MRWPWPWKRRNTTRTRSGAVRVVPRALTLGAYLDALTAAGVDDGEPWDASTAPPDACLAVLDALCAEVHIPAGMDVAEAVREQAAVQWGLMENARARALATAARVRARVEEAVGEGLIPRPEPGKHALLRSLSKLPPTERAAAFAEPLARALVLGEAGAVVRQAEEAEEKALNTAKNLNLN